MLPCFVTRFQFSSFGHRLIDGRAAAFAIMLAALNAMLPGAITTGAECEFTPADTTLKLKWNPFVSEWGGYTVDGCDGVNPKLKLAAGTTYTFDQSDATNWCARNAPTPL